MCVCGGGGGVIILMKTYLTSNLYIGSHPPPPPPNETSAFLNPQNPSRVYCGHYLRAPLPLILFALHCSAFYVNLEIIYPKGAHLLILTDQNWTFAPIYIKSTAVESKTFLVVMEHLNNTYNIRGMDFGKNRQMFHWGGSGGGSGGG